MATNCIAQLVESRRRLQRQRWDKLTPHERMANFARLQEASFRILHASSSDFLRHFFSRNLQSRRVEVIDGQWRPVSPDRRSQQP